MLNINALLTIELDNGNLIEIPCEVDENYPDSAYTEIPINDFSKKIDIDEDLEITEVFFSTEFSDLLKFKSFKLALKKIN